VGGHSGSSSFTTTFNFSQNLPTGTTESNGQLDCGSNVTASLTVPAYTTVYYEVAMNSTGGSANIWAIEGDSTDFEAVGLGGINYVELGTGGGGTLEFFMQGCGSTPTVALGLWGYFNSTSTV